MRPPGPVERRDTGDFRLTGEVPPGGSTSSLGVFQDRAGGKRWLGKANLPQTHVGNYPIFSSLLLA